MADVAKQSLCKTRGRSRLESRLQAACGRNRLKPGLQPAGKENPVSGGGLGGRAGEFFFSPVCRRGPLARAVGVAGGRLVPGGGRLGLGLELALLEFGRLGVPALIMEQAGQPRKGAEVFGV